MGKLGMLHSNSWTFEEGASTRQESNTSYSILYHFLVNTEWLGDLTQIWRNKEPLSICSLPLKFRLREVGHICFWVLNGKGHRAPTLGGKNIKPISRGSKQSPWQLSFMLYLFYRPPYFCLGDILHILPTVPCNSLDFNRLLLGISPNLIRYLFKPREWHFFLAEVAFPGSWAHLVHTSPALMVDITHATWQGRPSSFLLA